MRERGGVTGKQWEGEGEDFRNETDNSRCCSSLLLEEDRQFKVVWGVLTYYIEVSHRKMRGEIKNRRHEAR